LNGFKVSSFRFKVKKKDSPIEVGSVVFSVRRKFKTGKAPKAIASAEE